VGASSLDGLEYNHLEGGGIMATMQLSGPHLLNWPDILEELKRNNIALRHIRYVEVTTKDQEISSQSWQNVNKERLEIHAMAVLDTGKSVPLTLTTLTYMTQKVTMQASDLHLNDVVTLIRSYASDILAQKRLSEQDAKQLEQIADFLDSVTHYEV
jgi:hypothetical protein